MIRTVVISTVIANILTFDRCVLSAVRVLFAVQKSAQKICNAARGEGGEVKIRVEKGGSDPYPLPPGKPREKIQEPREPLETQSRANARTGTLCFPSEDLRLADVHRLDAQLGN